MKKIVLAFIALSLGFASTAQSDSTNKEKADTIKVGGMIIIRKGGNLDSTNKKNNLHIKQQRKK